MTDSTREIISRFEKSWIETEDTFDLLLSNGFERLIPVREFIRIQKMNGENRNFRIGTSLYTLIFSRSVDFGLREGQKRISIETKDNNDYIIKLSDGLIKYREYQITDLNDGRLTNLLRTLKDTLVD